MKSKAVLQLLGTTTLLAVLVSIGNAQMAEDLLRFSQQGLGVGARSLGMGGVGVANAVDYSALFRNPANLAVARNFEFSIGLSTGSVSNTATYLSTGTKSDISATNIDNIGIVYPVPTTRGSLTFAFGFGRAANFANTSVYSGYNALNSYTEALANNSYYKDMMFELYLSEIDTVNRRYLSNVTDNVGQDVTVTEGGGINSYSIGGAIDIAKNLSIGATLNLLTGSYTYDRVYVEQDTKNVYRNDLSRSDFYRFTLESSFKSDISGYNVLLGMTYRKQGLFRAGIALKTPTYYDISEEFSDVGKSEFYVNNEAYTYTTAGTTDYKIKTPFVFSGGVSFQVGDFLVLAGDAEYTDWTQMEFIDPSSDLVEENRLVRKNFQATTNLRGGAEVTLWSIGLRLRGGIMYMPSAYKQDKSNSDFNTIYYTGGIGFDLDENVAINASAIFGSWKTTRFDYSGPGAAPLYKYIDMMTSESLKANSFNVTLSYTF